LVGFSLLGATVGDDNLLAEAAWDAALNGNGVLVCDKVATAAAAV
jgi:hypothetical protein